MANPNEKAILNEFQARRSRLQNVASKLQELQSDVVEHEMVIKTLQPMDTGRKCFRLVGEVLVERTVGETLPAVTRNKDMLEHAIKTLEETYQALEKEIKEFQVKHQIRIVDNQGRSLEEPPEPEDQAAGSSKKQGGSSKSGQGVLVNAS